MIKLKTKLYYLGSRAQKLIKIDLFYFAKGGIWLTLGNIFSSLGAFILAIVFANELSKEVYGNYKYILSLFSLLSLASLPGMETAIARSVAKGYEGSFLPAVKSKIKWGLIGTVGALILGFYYFSKGNYLFAIPLFICSIFIPFFDSMGLYDAFLKGKKRFYDSSKYQTITQITSTLVLILAVFFTEKLYFIILAYFLPKTVLRLIFTKKTANSVSNQSIEPGAISFGKHVSIIRIINSFASNINNVAMFQLLGNKNLATYSFAVAPTEQARGFIGIIDSLLLPKMAVKERWQLSLKLFGLKITPFILSVTIGIIIYIGFAQKFYEIFFPNYIESVKYSQIYSASLLFTAINTLFFSILKGFKLIKEMHVLNILDITMNILGLPFIYFFGIYGMIFSVIFSKVIQMILMGYFIFYKKDFGQKS